VVIASCDKSKTKPYTGMQGTNSLSCDSLVKLQKQYIYGLFGDK